MKVALFTLAKDEDNYIEEFLDYYIKLGFDDIFVYQNNWRANLKNDFHGKVHLVEYDREAPQVPGMKDFIQNHWNEYDWAAFFDVDEFLILKRHNNIKDFLSDYSDFPAVAINMRLFGDSGKKNVENENYSVIQRFTHSDEKLFSLVKLILNFNIGKGNFNMFNPHIVNCRAIDPNKKKFTMNGNFYDNTENEIAELAHFRNKTYEECFKRKFKNTDVCYGYLDKIENPEQSGRTNIDLFNKEYEEHNKNNIENTSVLEFYKKISQNNKNATVVIVTFIYKQLSDIEIKSLQNYREIFKKRDIYAVVPENIDESVCKSVKEFVNGVIKFEKSAFESNNAYQIKICWNPEFYRLFKKYEYILIAHTDAWAFRDELDYWCGLGYDYIGAPWCNCGHVCKPPYDNSKVGNGGFSLRKISTFVDKMSSKHDISPIPEDVQICRRLNLKIPPCNEAIKFSSEWDAEFQVIQRGVRPMGCHNWKKLYNDKLYKKLMEINTTYSLSCENTVENQK